MRTYLMLNGMTALATSASATKQHADITAPNGTTTDYDTSYKHFDCGVSAKHGSDHFNDTVRAMHHGIFKPGSLLHKPGLHSRDTSMIDANAVFHVVTKTSSAGSITQAMADKQIAVMNEVYNPYNVNFILVNATFTVNDAWAVGQGSDNDAMKSSLRQGSYSTLNIYFQTDLYGSILGTCSLPSDIGAAPVDPKTYFQDGCNVQAGTMPGGVIQGYNLGKTAVHETGHWLGLLHVFEGYSCTGDGDFIADTPMQSTSTDGCPTKPAKDSCPAATGVDAVHNYMDYSTDACYTNFTPLQQARIADMWATYRKGR
ncbi:hypothetical protein AAFC00_005225 [Neodothiora populina]|uniref:Peptidase M43 pregnancy-associated plasma-A domain-containing protein n=1 Tax=Neodothiora populina TaxID=2781224 RepID=A0ABR3PK70_9PEZI